MSAPNSAFEVAPQPVRARCALGGPVPCVDDLCHGSDQTLCGMERHSDYCDHGFYPDTCKDCDDEEDPEWYG